MLRASVASGTENIHWSKEELIKSNMCKFHVQILPHHQKNKQRWNYIGILNKIHHNLKWTFGAAVAQEEEQSPTNRKVGGSTLASLGHLSKHHWTLCCLSMYEWSRKHITMYRLRRAVWVNLACSDKKRFEWSTRLEKHYTSTVHLHSQPDGIFWPIQWPKLNFLVSRWTSLARREHPQQTMSWDFCRKNG